MTDEQSFFLVKKYHDHLKSLKVAPIETDYNAYRPIKKVALNHLFSMLPKMENFLKQGRREKFFRWLGFIQGVLWILGEFSLNELRKHNRSEKE